MAFGWHVGCRCAVLKRTSSIPRGSPCGANTTKTDQLDTELVLRAFFGWPRGEKRHYSMVGRKTAEPRARQSHRLAARPLYALLLRWP